MGTRNLKKEDGLSLTTESRNSLHKGCLMQQMAETSFGVAMRELRHCLCAAAACNSKELAGARSSTSTTS